MPVDYKSAQHICNVVKRQVQACFPDLQLHFIAHKENERAKSFSTEARKISEHPAGDYVLKYRTEIETKKILSKNRTRFVAIARYNKPGFLGFLQDNSYLGLIFVNYERFDSEQHLKNQTLHCAWHAIALYKEYVRFRASKKTISEDNLFLDDRNILIPQLTEKQLYHRNLMADIFAASVQTLQGRDEAFDNISKQRVYNTLSAEIGFYAEQFPFPVCIDTLELIFKDNIEQFKNSKKPMQTAIKITEDIGKTYTSTSIEQWRGFSIPAQQMAWNGHDIETILGAAIYTGENTYVQSIADMVAETIDIKPKMVTSLHGYNPFTEQEVNSRAHQKMCKDLFRSIIQRITCPKDHIFIKDVIKNQNISFFDGQLLGWCAPALSHMAQLIREHDTDTNFQDILDHAQNLFEKEVMSIQWETMAHLSHILFKKRRNNETIDWESVLDITEKNDEFSSIHYGLKTTQQFQKQAA